MLTSLHEYSIEYIRCVNCQNKLELEILKTGNEVEEGFLLCPKCKTIFPIISSIPIMWKNFSAYLSSRKKLSGNLFSQSKTVKMKKFVKKSLGRKKSSEDYTGLEEKWARIYLSSRRSKFYSTIKNELVKIPAADLVFEHGCSIGFMTEFLSKRHSFVFGIDKSFLAVSTAKKNSRKNLDYFVADSLYHPFGKQTFGLVLALNLLEIIEPLRLLEIMSRQVKNGTLFITDPYDYERGMNSVKIKIDDVTLRKELIRLGFTISEKTKDASYIQWKLNINGRTILTYKTDLVIATK